MQAQNLKIGQAVIFTNGSGAQYLGTIVKIKPTTLVVVCDSSSIELWNAGGNVGSEITFNQVKNICCCEYNPSSEKLKEVVLSSNCCPIHNKNEHACYCEPKCINSLSF